MPRSTSEVAFHNFNKGLHTESSPFAFPPDALSVIDNIVLEANGTARRRYGVDYEAGYGLLATGLTDTAFGSAPTNSYKWDNVDNDPDTSLGLIQVSNKLYVIHISAEKPSAAASLLYTLDMAASPFDAWTGNSKLSFTALEGYLIVTAPTLNNVYRMYWSGSVLTPTAIEVEVRDFWGVDDGLTVAETYTGALTATHHYNLLNQGWTSGALTTYGTAPNPTNAQVWWLGKDSSDNFSKSLLNKQDFGTTRASKGRYIIGVKTRGADRKDASGITLPSTDDEQNNFTVVASFSGRAFYAGLDSDVPAGDIGTGGREIGFMYGMYKKLQHENTGVFTGKGLNWGGSLIRPEATGFGGVYFTKEMLETKNDSFEGKTVALSGFGNVTWGCALKVTEFGGKVVTISGPDGYVYDEKGLDADKIDYLLSLRASNNDIVSPYVQEFPEAKFFPGEKPWGVACDIAMPCATQNELDGEDAKKLVANGVKYVAEVSNMGCTPEAVDEFHGNKVLYAPGKAVNAGGVAVSGLEMSQNSLRFNWTREEVDQRLHQIMKDIHATCEKYGKDSSGFINYVNGANIGGFVKVADAMLAQGVV